MTPTLVDPNILFLVLSNQRWVSKKVFRGFNQFELGFFSDSVLLFEKSSSFFN